MARAEMPHENILTIAQKIAARLVIKINDPAIILANMKPKTAAVTILYNEDFTLWIDKHYIAYGDNFKPEVVYVFTDKEHISEELRSVCQRLKIEKSLYELKTLMSVKEQLELAQTAMRQSDSRLFFFEETQNIKTEDEDLKNKHEIMTLCSRCRTDYQNTGDYHIRRADPKQTDKKLCDYCSYRHGYNYELTPKERRGKR